ncbi:MAG: hypothetical protein ACO1QB_00800 [Verrucomicrobiales bacterium]
MNTRIAKATAKVSESGRGRMELILFCPMSEKNWMEFEMAVIMSKVNKIDETILLILHISGFQAKAASMDELNRRTGNLIQANGSRP